MYLVHFEQETGSGGSGQYGPEVIESNWIIPRVDDNGNLTLNVTTNSSLSTNMFYNATLFTAMDMMEAGSILFCTCTLAIYHLVKLGYRSTAMS